MSNSSVEPFLWGASTSADSHDLDASDVALLRELGFGACGFGIAWGRILPRGTGRVSSAGLDAYQRLVDALLGSGIVPVATLSDGGLPEALDDRGGWTNHDSAAWFADYADAVFRVLDDRVPMWATIEDPWSIVDGRYLRGASAPGRRPADDAARAACHLLLAHGAAVEAYRADGRNRIGLVVGLATTDPSRDRPGDRAEAERDAIAVTRQFLDPVFLGRFPDEMESVYGDAWRTAPPADLDRIQIPVDWLGLRVAGAGLGPALEDLRNRYVAIPLFVEGSAPACPDPPGAGDERDDRARVAWLRDQLEAVGLAREAGAYVCGYFVRPLFDGLDERAGSATRNGIVHVDRATRRRTPKASARFYADVIATGGRALSGWREEPPSRSLP